MLYCILASSIDREACSVLGKCRILSHFLLRFQFLFSNSLVGWMNVIGLWVLYHNFQVVFQFGIAESIFKNYIWTLEFYCSRSLHTAMISIINQNDNENNLRRGELGT